MLNSQIQPNKIYQHEIYKKVKVIEEVSHEWEYFRKHGKGVWRVFQYNSGRELLAINSEYFEYEF